MSASTHSRSFASATAALCNISPAKCRTETCAVLQVVLLAVQHLSVVLEVHAEASLWTSRIPMMSSVCCTGDGRPAPVMQYTSAGQTRKEREATRPGRGHSEKVCDDKHVCRIRKHREIKKDEKQEDHPKSTNMHSSPTGAAWVEEEERMAVLDVDF